MRYATPGLLAFLISATALADEPPFPPAGDAGIDQEALRKLKIRAEEAGSDAVVSLKDGRLVADWDFGRERGPIEAMSATKSIVSLAIGRLIDTDNSSERLAVSATYFARMRLFLGLCSSSQRPSSSISGGT
jgi:CubicO group peptidase (beta-lactamase class C family)